MVTRNKADAILRAPFYGYIKLRKATRKGKKSKDGLVVTPGNGTPNLSHRTTRTNLSSHVS